MDLGKALKQLGFTPEIDFVLQNDGDTTTVSTPTVADPVTTPVNPDTGSQQTQQTTQQTQQNTNNQQQQQNNNNQQQNQGGYGGY